MTPEQLDCWHMSRAMELARRGQGYVEPNPMVGCVIARGAEVIGEGWHRRFGQAHAEVEALRVAGRRAAGATMYVTLEPCSHFGKTPPCTQAVISSGIRRVVIALEDPFAEVSGRGIAALREAGLEVQVGVLQHEAEHLNAPYLKLVRTGRPWVIAKWAMTLDGKIATRSGASRWISSPQARQVVHQLRGRVDAVAVGRRTAEADDPLLTARPSGPRTATRIVLDSRAVLDRASRLVQTAHEVPVLIAVGPEAPLDRCRALEQAGCEVFRCSGQTRQERLLQLLDELGRRRMTNLLVEGGAQLLGQLFDAGQIDELHVFVAPKLFGGGEAPGPIGGFGFDSPDSGVRLEKMHIEQVGPDLYVHGRVARQSK